MMKIFLFVVTLAVALRGARNEGMDSDEMEEESPQGVIRDILRSVEYFAEHGDIIPIDPRRVIRLLPMLIPDIDVAYHYSKFYGCTCNVNRCKENVLPCMKVIYPRELLPIIKNCIPGALLSGSFIVEMNRCMIDSFLEIYNLADQSSYKKNVEEIALHLVRESTDINYQARLDLEEAINTELCSIPPINASIIEHAEFEHCLAETCVRGMYKGYYLYPTTPQLL